jgi:hypothetical protein
MRSKITNSHTTVLMADMKTCYFTFFLRFNWEELHRDPMISSRIVTTGFSQVLKLEIETLKGKSWPMIRQDDGIKKARRTLSSSTANSRILIPTCDGPFITKFVELLIFRLRHRALGQIWPYPVFKNLSTWSQYWMFFIKIAAICCFPKL